MSFFSMRTASQPAMQVKGACLRNSRHAANKPVVVSILFRPHVQASLFKLYELTAIASAAVGEPEPQLVELLAALAREVAPGSSEHLFWAQQYR
jgi:hypothetical protein